MFRSARAGASIGVVMAAVAAGCVPGAVGPRRGGAGGAGGGAIGGETITLRDASAAEVRMGAAGVGGSAGRPGEAAGAAGGSSGTSELPPVDAADAARSSIHDGAADALAGDARTPRDATADAPAARAPRPGELAIDELLVNPTGDDLGREWIELSNRSRDWLDLSALHLSNASVDLAVAAGAIAPAGLRVLGQSADPTKNGGAPVDVAYGTKLILGNANGTVSVCLGACASGLVLDTVSWGTLDDDTVGHALVVDPLTRSICVADTPFGTGGSFGTPGLPNPPCGQDAGVDGSADAASR
jgi:hypothetical protein